MRKMLLDTQALLWLRADDPRLTTKAKKVFLDSRNEIFLSIVSVWELAIKKSVKKLELDLPLKEFLRSTFTDLGIALFPLTLDHCIHVEQLPFYHRDPFDRLLISQALVEGLAILGADETFDDYAVQRIW